LQFRCKRCHTKINWAIIVALSKERIFTVVVVVAVEQRNNQAPVLIFCNQPAPADR